MTLASITPPKFSLRHGVVASTSRAYRPVAFLVGAFRKSKTLIGMKFFKVVRVGLAQNKIFNSVVSYVTIDVMYFLFGIKKSSDILFYNHTMLINISASKFMRMVRVITFYKSVSIVINHTAFPVVMVTSICSFIYGWHMAFTFQCFRNFFSNLWALCPVHFNSFRLEAL